MTALPLTPIERYFFHDHRETHPAWISFEFTFEGRLEREPFTRAWQKIPRLHPLTSATVATRFLGGPVWKLGTVQPELAWSDAANAGGGAVVFETHNLATRSGFLGHVHTLGSETRLTLHIHHAVADGGGLLLIAEDLFTLYAIECGQALAQPDARGVRSQKSGTLGDGFKLRQLLWLCVGVPWAMVLGRQRVVEFCGTRAAPETEKDAGQLTSFSQSAETLRPTAQHAKASLNELLIRDVQAAAGLWLQRHGQPGADEWVRLLVPVNLGGTRSETRVSANAFGVALLERRVRSLTRRERLLQRAREDMAFIRRRGLMAAFGGALWLRGFVPGGIARHCRRSGARSTLVFSNLGKVFSRGPLVRADGVLALPGAVLTRFACWGPCRPATNLFVMAAEYRGGISFGVSFDPAKINAAQAQDFADEFRRQLTLSQGG